MDVEAFLERTEARRLAVAQGLDPGTRAGLGQYFTPAPVADFLASLLRLPTSGPFSLLDPGAGVGSLSAAVVARVLRDRPDLELTITAFEMDEGLIPHLRATLADAETLAAAMGRRVLASVVHGDFVEWAAEQSTLNGERQPGFAACIMNPPYRKVNNGGRDRRALERIGLRVTNLYPAFMALAAELLEPHGQLSAITPRSFANGPYFEPFRRFFLARMGIERLHVYEKRGEVFADADVLQENVVMLATRGAAGATVILSSGEGFADVPRCREVPYDEVVRPDDPHRFVRIPVEADATEIAEMMAALPQTLLGLGVQVSTGRVVDFRSAEHLRDAPDGSTVPLIYPGHLGDFRVPWPPASSRKPTAIVLNQETRPLLVPSGTYVLVKRFTAKEERRRVVAAVLDPADVTASWFGIENHLNVFHRDGRGIEPTLARGLAAFLSTTTVDRFVRQFSGHTQINATDLRHLRYPAAEELWAIGRAVESGGWPTDQRGTDNLIAEHVEAWPAQPSDDLIYAAES